MSNLEALHLRAKALTRTSVPGREGANVTAQKVLHAGIGRRTF